MTTVLVSALPSHTLAYDSCSLSGGRKRNPHHHLPSRTVQSYDLSQVFRIITFSRRSTDKEIFNFSNRDTAGRSPVRKLRFEDQRNTSP